MDPSTLFIICNASVLPFWALLLFVPNAEITNRMVHSALAPAVLGVIYSLGMFLGAPAPEGGGFGSLEAVMLLFAVPEVVVFAWIHYLVFDLFVGAWIGRDSRRVGIPHLAVVPCQIFTFMLGPFGLLLYLTLRGATRRVGTLQER